MSKKGNTTKGKFLVDENGNPYWSASGKGASKAAG